MTRNRLRILATAATVGVFIGALAAPKASADASGWIAAGDDRALMQEIVDTAGYVSEKYGVGPIFVTSGWIGGVNKLANASRGEIIINRWYSTSREALDGAYAGDVASGYHNPGCTAAQSLALHESAHIIDERTGYSAQRELLAAAPFMTGELSGYSFNVDGSLNPGEALAEAFQAAECGTANEAEYQIYEMLVS